MSGHPKTLFVMLLHPWVIHCHLTMFNSLATNDSKSGQTIAAREIIVHRVLRDSGGAGETVGEPFVTFMMVERDLLVTIT